MAARKPVGGFNKDYLTSVKKEKFLSDHKHLEESGFTPELLTEIWDKANPKKSEKKD